MTPISKVFFSYYHDLLFWFLISVCVCVCVRVLHFSSSHDIEKKWLDEIVKMLNLKEMEIWQ